MSIPFKLLAPQDVLESFYANVQRSKTIHMVMLDTDGVIVASNRATAQLFGRSPDQLAGQSWFELAIPEVSRSEIRAVFLRLLATGLPEVHQNDIALPDGSHRVMIWSNSLMHSGDQLTGVVSFGIDITEQSRAHDILKQEQQLLARAEHMAGLGTYVLDVRSGLWDSSPVLDRIFGITDVYPRTIRGWLDLVHPDDRGMMSDYFSSHVLAQHQPFDKTYRIVRKSDGATRTVHGFGELDIEPGGNVLRMLGTIQDITELVSLQAKLVQSETRFGTLFNTAPDGILLMKDGAFIDCNAAALEMFGCARERIISHRPYELSPPMQPDGRSSKESSDEKIAAALNGKIQRFHWRHTRCDGTPFDASVTLNRIDLNGVPHLHAIVRDETSRFELDEQRRKADERFRLAAKHTGMLVYDWDIKRGRIVWEGAARELTGYESAAFPASTIAGWSELIHPDDRDQALSLLERAQKTKATYRATYRFRKMDGTYFTVEDSGSFIFDDAGDAIRMVGTMRDSSAQDTLRRQYQLLIEQVPDGMSIFRNGVFLYMNPAGLTMMRAARLSDVVGTSVMDTVAPESRDEVARRIARVESEHATNEPYVLKLLRKDGTTYDAETRSAPIMYQGQPAVLLFVREVTAEEAAKRSLASQSVELQKLLSSMHDGFASHEIICDTAGNPIDYRFLMVNPAFERLTGKRAADIVGKTVKDVFPSTEDVWIRRYGHVALTGQPAEFTHESRSVSGKIFHVSAWSSQKNRFAVIFRDVTESSHHVRQLSSILDHAIDSVVIMTPAGICTYQNAASKPMLGYEPAELIGQNLLSFIHPSDVARTTERITEALSKPNTPVPLSFRLKHKNGTWLELESVSVNLVADPVVNGILVFSKDVSAIRAGTKAIERNEELETLNKAMIGRELRIDELKQQVRTLTERLAKMNAS